MNVIKHLTCNVNAVMTYEMPTDGRFIMVTAYSSTIFSTIYKWAIDPYGKDGKPEKILYARDECGDFIRASHLDKAFDESEIAEIVAGRSSDKLVCFIKTEINEVL